MKNIFNNYLFYILCSFFVFISNWYADLNKDFLNFFDKSCYENVAIISNNKKNNVIKIENVTDDVILTQDDSLLFYKYLNKSKKYIEYNVKSSSVKNLSNTKYVNDNDINTFLEFDIYNDNQNYIILEFDDIINANQIEFEYYFSSWSIFDEYISQDWKNRIKPNNKIDFEYKYQKIVFLKKPNWSIQNTKIFEIKIWKVFNPSIITKTQNESDIFVWKNNKCRKILGHDIIKLENKYFSENQKISFLIDKDTISLQPARTQNQYFDKKLENYIPDDIDKDGILDYEDNCPNIYNLDQKDINSDWIGDLCSDDDSDWIDWNIDNCPYIKNINQEDINNNWIWDLCEFDKDKDLITDGYDNCINIYNPNQEDDDKDDIWNLCDNCFLSNKNQEDLDNNGIWDICDQTKKFEQNNDMDDDWIFDTLDNCKEIKNPNQEDDDKDGIWNLCDNCINIKNINQKDIDKNWIGDFCEDVDMDGFVWYMDNCEIKNIDQKDSDNDGIGDFCEDYDSDGILSFYDNCPYTYNPNQIDIDKDGIWDLCDDIDSRFVESNKEFFIFISFLIILFFGIWIFFMIQKIKSNNSKQ